MLTPEQIRDLAEALDSFARAVWSDCRLPGDMRRDLAAVYHTQVVPALRRADAACPNQGAHVYDWSAPHPPLSESFTSTDCPFCLRPMPLRDAAGNF